jgi:hypothetical protein
MTATSKEPSVSTPEVPSIHCTRSAPGFARAASSDAPAGSTPVTT